MKKIILVIAVLVAASLACNLLSSVIPSSVIPSATFEPPIQIQPTVQELPTLPVQPVNTVLFSDDFSDPNSGWDQVNEDYKITDYTNGGYRMWLSKTQYDVWANPYQDFSGYVSIEVDATKVAGPDNNDFGIQCNYQDTDNFYFGLISSDGYAVIGKVLAGDTTYLSSDQMQPADGINTGSATNHLQFVCNNGELTLFANGWQVAYVANDASFTSGDVGLQAGTFEEGGVDMLFDNFVVTSE